MSLKRRGRASIIKHLRERQTPVPHLFTREKRSAYARRIAETNARNLAAQRAREATERRRRQTATLTERQVLERLAELTEAHGPLRAAQILFGGAS